MRAIFAPTEWRLPHWLIAIGSALFFAIYVGVVEPYQIFSWFASRPEVAQAFSEPHFGRADALILVFSTMFLGPFALFVAAVLLIFAVAMLGGFVLPLVRWFSFPDWTANVLVLTIIAVVAWMQSGLWMPRTLWFFGMLARAWKIILA
jgi:hypothetical protein